MNLEKIRTYSISLFAMLLQPALQFFLFAFYAKVFGPEKYGSYLVLMAWVPICLELVGLGAGEYLVKMVSRNKNEYDGALRNFYSLTVMTLPFALLIYTGITVGLIGDYFSIGFIALIGALEFVGCRLMIGAEQAAISLGRMMAANYVRVLFAVSRVSFVGGYYAFFGQDRFELLILSGSIGVFVFGCVSLFVFGSTKLFFQVFLDKKMALGGVWFSGNQVVRAGQQNVDRLVLSACLDPATLAVFGVAQRFVQIGIVPIQAVLRIHYPGFFREGKNGLSGAVSYGKSIFPHILGAALATCLLLWICSNFLVELIGQGYEKSVDYLVMLAPTLVLIAINYVSADILSGADKQRLRTVLMASGVLLQALLYYLLNGSSQIVWAAYIGLSLSSLLLVSSIIFMLKNEPAL